MSRMIQSVHKTAAQREAEAILLRNAPDEDQLLREYLTKKQKREAAIPAARTHHVRYKRAGFAHDYSGRRWFCG